MRCPLLEDINLEGARGILVNITASSNLGMREFESVGATIGSVAAENAMLVIGTALDESIGDEVRITLVATGLGHSEQPAAKQTMRLVSPEPAPAPESATAGGASGSDYRRYEVPTIIRKQPDRAEPVQMFEEDSDYQKIPVFLRRQKD